MSASSTKRVVYAALIGNSLIAVIKFAAATITGSSAMLSEAIHSVVDTANQGLLLVGLNKAQRPADEEHPFGYGKELYFWAFVVAVLLFSMGAGVSLYEGVQKILHPHPISNPTINYVVLLLAAVFEGVAWWVAFKEFQKSRGEENLLEALQHSKDPAIFTVLFEDTAALIGLFVAFIGILAADIGGIAWADGAASVAIGLILASAAWILAYETKSLLIGESANKRVTAGIKAIIKRQPHIRVINELRTMHLGPNDVLLVVSLDFRGDISAGTVEDTITELEETIKSDFPEITKIFIEAQSEADHLQAEKTRAAERS